MKARINFTHKDILNIRARYIKGVRLREEAKQHSTKQIARDFGCANSTVHDIVVGNSYRYGPFPEE